MRSRNVTKNLLAGAMGGLLASYAMSQFQSFWAAAVKELSTPRIDPEQSPRGDDATVKTAQAISTVALDHELTTAEKKWAGPAVHYATGIMLGTVYGVVAERVPAIRSGRGIAYGTAVWLIADEIVVPSFGLTPPFSKTPAISHLKALASHLIFGFTTELTRRVLR